MEWKLYWFWGGFLFVCSFNLFLRWNFIPFSQFWNPGKMVFPNNLVEFFLPIYVWYLKIPRLLVYNFGSLLISFMIIVFLSKNIVECILFKIGKIVYIFLLYNIFIVYTKMVHWNRYFKFLEYWKEMQWNFCLYLLKYW